MRKYPSDPKGDCSPRPGAHIWKALAVDDDGK